jgi:hypothetical protein
MTLLSRARRHCVVKTLWGYLGRVCKRLVVLGAAIVAALAGCGSSSASAKRIIPKPTPSPTSIAVIFSGCGSAIYVEPTPPGFSPRAGATPESTPQDAWGSQVTTADALSYVHQSIQAEPSVAHDTVSCGVKQFGAADVKPYMHLTFTPASGIFVVVAYLRSNNASQSGKYQVYMIAATRPLVIYGENVYPANQLPDVFKGIVSP